MQIYKNQEKERRKSKEVKLCLKCEFNYQGFCNKFKLFCSTARQYCINQEPVKSMKDIFASINKAVASKKEKIHKEIMNRK